MAKRVRGAVKSLVAFVQEKCYKPVGNYLFEKCDPTALALFRILFGFCMFLDVPQERGLEEADFRFGDPNYCFFPLFPFLEPLKLSHACIVYSVMWMGSVGIMLGIRFRLSCFLHLIPYVYFQLLDKSRWNNHSYLFALTVILLVGSDAGKHMSVDNYLSPTRDLKRKPDGGADSAGDADSTGGAHSAGDADRGVPRWNYFMLKFQFFILYFYAAVKKIDADWLSGYPMKNLANHWVFSPFTFVAPAEVVELYMIHLGGFFYDLTVGFLLNIQCTKKLAFLLSFMFHGMNSQLFTIGMFPYVCLASLIIFCEPHEFPNKLFNGSSNSNKKSKGGSQPVMQDDMTWTAPTNNSDETEVVQRADEADVVQKAGETDAVEKAGESEIVQRAGETDDTMERTGESETVQRAGEMEAKEGARCWKILLMTIYMCVQIFLPFTHSITKGYNNWTPGLYGYSWDMMVHSWSTLHIKVTVVDLNTKSVRYLDPDVWVTNDRWSSHADMAKQYAGCISRNLAQSNVTDRIQVYLDVWKSLNGRFQQRVFDHRVDILEAPWSPWEPVPWVLPLLTQYSHWRKERIDEIAKNVANWTASSNVVFVADYPGLFLENYLPRDLTNVTLTLLNGEIVVEQKSKETGSKLNVTLTDKSSEQYASLAILTGSFHRIYTVSPTPSSYMYTYTNATLDRLEAKAQEEPGVEDDEERQSEVEILIQEFYQFIQDKLAVFARSFYLIFNAYMNVLLDVPMVVRRMA